VIPGYPTWMFAKYFWGFVELSINRKLSDKECIVYKDHYLKEHSLDNILLISDTATARELWAINRIVLGYSHCLCGCGGILGDPDTIEFKLARPRAFLQGHNPAFKRAQAICI
jgi:hypothetical protein